MHRSLKILFFMFFHSLTLFSILFSRLLLFSNPFGHPISSSYHNFFIFSSVANCIIVKPLSVLKIEGIHCPLLISFSKIYNPLGICYFYQNFCHHIKDHFKTILRPHFDLIFTILINLFIVILSNNLKY